MLVSVCMQQLIFWPILIASSLGEMCSSRKAEAALQKKAWIMCGLTHAKELQRCTSIRMNV